MTYPLHLLTLALLFATAQLPAQLPYPTQFIPQGFGGGGYMYAPSMSPLDPNHFFINCDMGGMYRLGADPASTQRLLLNEYNQLFFSGNGGATWNSVFAPADGKIWLGGVFWDGPNIYFGTNHA